MFCGCATIAPTTRGRTASMVGLWRAPFRRPPRTRARYQIRRLLPLHVPERADFRRVGHPYRDGSLAVSERADPERLSAPRNAVRRRRLLWGMQPGTGHLTSFLTNSEHDVNPVIHPQTAAWPRPDRWSCG